MSSPDPEAPEADAAEQATDVALGGGFVESDGPAPAPGPESDEIDDGDRAESAIEVPMGDDDYR